MCICQAYLAASMNNFHYQIKRDELPTLLKAVETANDRLQGGAKTVSLVIVPSTQDSFSDAFFEVLNNPSPEVLSDIQWGTMEQILRSCSEDPVRGNKCADFGYTSGHNSRREEECDGLVRSRVHKDTRTPEISALLLGATRAIRVSFPEAALTTYNDGERNAALADKLAHGNIVEAARVARTNNDTLLLRPHVDDGNCLTPQYAKVACFSRYHVVDGVLVRDALITYGKKEGNKHMRERDFYGTAVLAATRLYDKLSPMQRNLDCSAFPIDQERVEHPFCFLDKGCFYSTLASGIQRVFDKYTSLGTCPRMAAAFLVPVVMSESVDHYYKICEELLENESMFLGMQIEHLSALQVGVAITQEIFRRKRHSGKKEPDVQVAYSVAQRHAPAVNKPPTEDQVKGSIDIIEKLIRQLRLRIDWNPTLVTHYYGITVEYLYTYAFGAGHLTAQTIIGVAACLGLFPVAFYEMAEIGVSTRTFKFLVWAFGFSKDPKIAYQQTHCLLRAIAVKLNMSVKKAEELLCTLAKAKAPRRKGYERTPCTIEFDTCDFELARLGRFCDVVYLRQYIYQLVDGCMYYVDCNGVTKQQQGLLTDTVLSTIATAPDKVFWGRRFDRSFQGKAATVSRKIEFLGDCFATKKRSDDYDPGAAKGPSWNQRGDYCWISIGDNIEGPTNRSVALSYHGREPLNIRQLVWTCTQGKGRFRNSMFVGRNIQSYLVHPPCVANGRNLIKQKTFFAYAIAVKDPSMSNSPCGTLYWPETDFGMYPSGKNNWFDESTTRHKSQFFGRGIPPYPWNYSRIMEAAEEPRRLRYFASARYAKYYATSSFFFRFLHRFDMSHPQVRSVNFLANPGAKGRFGTIREHRPRLRHAEDVRVFYDSSERNSSRNRLPFLIAILYRAGGMAYYFCNDSGARTSGVHLRRPRCRVRRNNENSSFHELVCLTDHKVGAERTRKFPGCATNVVVLWATGETTEEPLKTIFEDCPSEVLRYAEQNGLLEESGWSKVSRLHDIEEKARLCALEREGQHAARRKGAERRPKSVCFATHAGMLQNDGDIDFIRTRRAANNWKRKRQRAAPTLSRKRRRDA